MNEPVAKPTRLGATRRKVRLVRYVVGAGSVAAFGGFALAARAGHTGKSTASATAASAVAQSSSDDFGSSSLAPSDNSAPVVQSSGS
jgi:hypothetical protein